jgi:hypothetical protein
MSNLKTYGLERSNSLVPLSGKTFERFPSGLERVTQEFVCRADRAESARREVQQGQAFPLSENLEQAGQGFFIFPQPQESYDIPGFCKITVTAYSSQSVTGFGQITISDQIVSLSQDFEQIVLESEESPTFIYWTIFEKWRVKAAVYSGVIVEGGNIPLVFGAVDLIADLALVDRRIVGDVGGATEIPIEWKPEIVSITRRNFGRYDEFDATETLVPKLPFGVFRVETRRQ